MTRKIWGIVAAACFLTGSAAWSYFRDAVQPAKPSHAAAAWVNTLDADQKQAGVLAFDVPQRVDWHFIPKAERKGVQIKDMTEPQRVAAHALLRSVLSEVGYDKSVQIMDLERLLHELEAGKGQNIRDPERYYFTFFGTGRENKWGLSVEGHHLSLNFVFEGEKIVASTPQVFCVNPAEIKAENASGIAVGTRVLKGEEQLAFDLLHALSDEQRATAIFDATALKEVRGAGEPQPPQAPPVGIAASELSVEQQTQLRNLITVYTAAMTASVAEDRWTKIDAAGFDKVHFGWAGAAEPGVGHYYRIHGPTFVVEFVNTQPDAAGNPANHIHAMWRDMQGDFDVAIAK